MHLLKRLRPPWYSLVVLDEVLKEGSSALHFPLEEVPG